MTLWWQKSPSLFDSVSDMPGFCPLESSGEIFFFFNTNVKDPTPDIQIQVSGGAWEMLSYFKNSPDESHGQLMLKTLALEPHTFV